MSAQVSPMLSTDELLGRIKHAYRKAEDGRATYEKLIPEWYERIGDRQTAASILERELEIGRKWAYKLLPPPPQKPEEKQGDETPQASATTENIEENAARAHTEIRVPSPVTSDVVEDALDLVRHMTCRQWQRFIYLLDINEWLPTKGTQEGDAILDAGRKQMERNSEH